MFDVESLHYRPKGFSGYIIMIFIIEVVYMSVQITEHNNLWAFTLSHTILYNNTRNFTTVSFVNYIHFKTTILLKFAPIFMGRLYA